MRQRMVLCLLAGLFLCLAPLPAAATYRFSYFFTGQANSKLLLFIPFRTYFEASAYANFCAEPDGQGGWHFVWAGARQVGYVLRTLGFSGKSVALISAGEDFEQCRLFSESKLASWTFQFPEFGRRIKKSYFFTHRVLSTENNAFVFDRDVQGVHRNVRQNITMRYRYFPSTIGMYFNIFPLMAEILRFYNHRLMPDKNPSRLYELPSEWLSDELDFTAPLNHVGMLLEKVVEKMVTVKQEATFRLRYHIQRNPGQVIEICGEAWPKISVWKGFMITAFLRRVRINPRDNSVLSDQIRVDIRNEKGQGGFGLFDLQMIEEKQP